MKTTFSALAFAAAISSVDAYWKGFNLVATMPDGSCKTQADWAKDFAAMKALPGDFTSARVYASSDCNTLANAVPAAIAAGSQILASVWTEDADHYSAEKAALLSAVQTYGVDWLVAVTVGSEDLYRGDTTASALAQQIYDVRGMLSTVNGGSAIQVGHVDTWTEWVADNDEVITACDFIATDGYPYYQNTESNSIDEASTLFWTSMDQVRARVNSVHPNAWVWISETGWPTAGDQENEAVASVENAAAYWSTVACEAFEEAHTFWYVLQDYSASPSFGVLNNDYSTKYSLSC